MDEPQNAEKQINNLKGILKGKRKYILKNIEARYVGYQKGDENEAIEILESVPKGSRDRQWYAVKRQLLENCISKQCRAQRNALAQIYTEKLKVLDDMIEQKYGARLLSNLDLLPDA